MDELDPVRVTSLFQIKYCYLRQRACKLQDLVVTEVGTVPITNVPA